MELQYLEKESVKRPVIVRTVSVPSSSFSNISAEEQQQALHHGVVKFTGQAQQRVYGLPATEPSKLSTLAKGKEIFAFAGGCLRTYANDLPHRHKAVSAQGDFVHYVVDPWYEWFGRNKRVTTSQALSTITLRTALGTNHGKPEGAIINGGSFNYAGTYGMSAQYETLHQACLDALPVDGAATPLVEQALCEEVAAFWGASCCFTTPTGYQSNILALTAILDKSWFVFMDHKAHSSISTAAYLADAGGRKKFRHNDMHDLERMLLGVEGRYGNIMVAVEGLYSLDGDLPDLAALWTLKSRYKFVLYCDEAHSFLSLGKTGRGCLEWWNDMHPAEVVPVDLIDIRTTTLSKAVGGVGGLVCATARFSELLGLQSAHLRMTGESLSTPTMLQTLWILRQPERLRRNLARLRAMSSFCHEELERAGVFVYGDGSTPILPIHAGRPTKASKLSYVLRRHGVAATPFSKPAVPMWQSRVRIGMSAEFTDGHVNQLVEALIKSCAKANILQGRKRCMICHQSHETLNQFQSNMDYSGLKKGRDDALQSLYDLIKAQRTRTMALQASTDQIDNDVVSSHSREVVEAGHASRKQYGLGSGSSRWILGTYPPHLEVERLVCEMTDQPAAMLYTNTEVGLMSTVAALCRPIKGCKKHWLVLPRTTQQSVNDGYRAAPLKSGTTMVKYGDLDELQNTLRRFGQSQKTDSYVTVVLNVQDELAAVVDRVSTIRRKFQGMTILLDSTFNLPSPQLASVAAELDARLLIFSSFYHTLKGLNGAFLAGDKTLMEELRYTSRCYVFTAAPAPYMMGMVAEALKERCVGADKDDDIQS